IPNDKTGIIVVRPAGQAMAMRSAPNSNYTRLALILGATLTLAFLIRLAVRLAFGEDNFWRNSYYIYYTLAQNIVSGKGFVLENTYAWLPPVYPLFLT